MRTVFFSTLFILFGGIVSSATLKAETLSLSQAVGRALHIDPRLRERQQIVNVARAMEKEAIDSDGLSFDINFFVGLAQIPPDGQLTTNNNGQIVSPADDHNYEGIAPWYNLRLGIVKPLYSFGRAENYSAAAKQNIAVKQGDVALVKTKIKYDVYQTYYGYLAARDSRLLLEDIKSRLKKAIDLVENWLREGETTGGSETKPNGNAKQSDVFALQTGAALVNRYLAEFQGAEKITLARLKTLTGVSVSKPLEVADKGIVPVEFPMESLKELQKKALANRPEIAQFKANLNARRNLIRANQSNIKPNIYAALVGSFATTPDSTNLNNPFLYDPLNYVGATPALGLGRQWNRNRGRQPAQVMQAQAKLNALAEKSVVTRQGIPLQVAEQYQFVHTHYTIVEELAKGSRAGRRWMISSYADFEAGLEKSEQIMTAFQGYVLAHIDYLRAVNDFNMSVIGLKSVTGEL
ncbi:MAG: TolC family protein [Gammaproteobacteria bacterium]|nr:TolC family protein [Gammaproteobacteria bacterium]